MNTTVDLYYVKIFCWVLPKYKNFWTGAFSTFFFLKGGAMLLGCLTKGKISFTWAVKTPRAAVKHWLKNPPPP